MLGMGFFKLSAMVAESSSQPKPKEDTRHGNRTY